MKILLTGYKGFIGKNFMMELLNTDHQVSTFEWGEDLPKIEGLDWVIHLGADSSTTCSEKDAKIKNYRFSVWLYEQCKIHNVNLQWASSASVYGNQNTTFKESDEKNPESFYAESKSRFEDYIEKDNNNIIVQGFRYFNVFGPFEDHKGNMASPYHQFTQQAKDGVIKIFEGSDKYKRDFVHVQQIIDTHFKMLDIKESGVWNIGTGEATTFLEVAESIAEKYNAKIEYIPFPEKLKGQYQEYTCADMTKLNNTLRQNLI